MGAGKIKILLISLAALVFLSVPAQDIRVGLFEDHLVKTMVFHCTEESYDVISGNRTLLKLNKGDLLYISVVNDRITLHNGTFNADSLSSVKFSDPFDKSFFSIKVVDPAIDLRYYSGDLEVNMHNSFMQVINQTPLEKYIAGVAETEGGSTAPLEYYKAQAVISRTFALRSWDRHESQGFNLCDGMHCQAYHGINNESNIIYDAVLTTFKMVINDRKFTLINPVYHSNSGGETQRAEDVWLEPVEYLQAVIDPFSEKQKNSRWRTSITLREWRRYLLPKLHGDTTKLKNEMLLITQPHRQKNLIIRKDTLLIATIRTDIGLRSSFFSMSLKGDSIIVNGRGYGHGVGLSQEGAMEMARQGYSYRDILGFYYHQVEVSDIDDLPNSALPEEFR